VGDLDPHVRGLVERRGADRAALELDVLVVGASDGCPQLAERAEPSFVRATGNVEIVRDIARGIDGGSRSP
jgi:hypothetical protein